MLDASHDERMPEQHPSVAPQLRQRKRTSYVGLLWLIMFKQILLVAQLLAVFSISDCSQDPRTSTPANSHGESLV